MIRTYFRRSPALAAAFFSLGAGALLLSLARAAHLPLLPLAAGLVSGALIAWITLRGRLRRKRERNAPRSLRNKVLAGGRPLTGAYDLAQDKSTDGQRWLM
jgi:Flp pilus assembly protein TadB